MNRIILGVVLFLAAYYDQRQNRIPNWLCAIGMGAGIFGLFVLGSKEEGLWHLVLPAGLLLILFPLWFLKVVGGGDVKLIVTAAVLLGRNFAPFLICAAICIGIHALLLMFCRMNYVRRMSLFVRHVMECLEEHRIKPYPFDCAEDSEDGGIRVSYGFLLGHLIAMLLGMYH